MSTLPEVASHIATLREAFDATFAAAPTETRQELVDLVAIQVGDEDYAVRIDQIGGLHAGLAVTTCPGPLPEMLGVAGLQGTIMAVYDLAAMLGRPASPNRWYLRAKGQPLIFAFRGFDSHLRLAPDQLMPHREADGHVTAIARTGTGDLQVLDLNYLTNAIRDRLPGRPTRRE